MDASDFLETIPEASRAYVKFYGYLLSEQHSLKLFDDDNNEEDERAKKVIALVSKHKEYLKKLCDNGNNNIDLFLKENLTDLIEDDEIFETFRDKLDDINRRIGNEMNDYFKILNTRESIQKRIGALNQESRHKESQKRKSGRPSRKRKSSFEIYNDKPRKQLKKSGSGYLKWLPEEIELLTKLVKNNASKKQISDTFKNREWGSIGAKIRRLNITSHEDSETDSRLSDDMDSDEYL